MLVVAASATLSGYTAASFGAAERSAFASGLATSLGVAASSVTVTGVSDAPASGRRRDLLQSSGAVVVAFTVTSTSTALLSSVTALGANPSALVSALGSAGLSSLRGVAVSSPTLTVQTGSGPPPRVSGITLTPATSPVNPSAALTLSATVISSAPAASLRLVWSQSSGPPLALTDSSVVGTALDTSTLGLLPGALQPGASYVFTIRATDANGQASRDVRVDTLAVPTGGVLNVSSPTGYALNTSFTLVTSNWTDGNVNATGLPLQYLFSYTVTGAAGVDSTPVLLSAYSGAPTLSGVLLPAGNVTLRVVAQNALGAVCLAPATAQVSVQTQVFTSPAAQASFLTTLIATSAAANVSASTSVALVTSAAVMLNDPDSALNANVTAAASVREQLLRAISVDTAAAAATPAAIEAVASAVAQLVTNASQVSPGGADAALALLSSVSTAGTDGRQVPISNATSYAVANGLSSIVGAALATSSAVNTSVLARVLDVVNQQAASQLAQLTVPGAPPVEVSSPAIQTRVQLDVPGAASRLFSAPLTAPGSASAFAPLPADIFAGASGNLSAGVRTQFASLAFDPYSNGSDPTSTGITRLAFSTRDGAEVDVSNLSAPVTFTLPPLANLTSGAKAQCQFWDTAATPPAYATRGCASIPSPVPPNHTLAWVANFSAASDADMAAAWTISGPLVDDLNCTRTVLDCSQPDAGVIYPNPAKPLTVPAVGCTAIGSTAPMLVIGGSRCALIQEDNPTACWWNNSKQAFTGAGCVASGPAVQCACRHVRALAPSPLADAHAN